MRTLERPRPRPRLADLTIGQVLGLLQLHSGKCAAAIADDLRRKENARATPEDLCRLVMLGLAYASRGAAMQLTGEGVDMAWQIIGD